MVNDGHGNHHPLAHPAGKLVWVLVHAGLGRGDADLGEGLDHPFPHLLGVHLRVMESQYLSDLLPDGEHRVQGGHGLLEDHSQLITTDPAHLLL